MTTKIIMKNTSAAVLAALCLLGSANAQTTRTSQFEYDAVGNLTKMTDPRGISAQMEYDPLLRLKKSIEPPSVPGQANGEVVLEYDGANQIQSVTDPRGLQTTYDVNGLGDSLLLTSPDTGVTENKYDLAGNTRWSFDARSKRTRYTYDALYRVTLIDYPSGIDTQIEWDAAGADVPGAKGQITRIDDESGNTVYTYDWLGRVTRKVSVIGEATTQQSLTTDYSYVTTGIGRGQLASITYPSGNRINYGYDPVGRVEQVTLNPRLADGSGPDTSIEIVILDELKYHPFGGPLQWQWGNGALHERSYDVDGRLTSYPIGDPSGDGVVRTIVYDDANRIVAYQHADAAGAAVPTLDQSFGYDDLDRLVSWSSAAGTQAYEYDLNGNRTALSIGGNAYPYTVAADSNRLDATAGPDAADTMTYDAAGNLVNSNKGEFVYSPRGRLKLARLATGNVLYLYNGMGQRVYKRGPLALVPTRQLRYAYDEAGALLGQYDIDGNATFETVRIGMMPVAALSSQQLAAGETTSVRYASTDQILTVRGLMNPSDGNLAWRWDGADPFGAALPDNDPNGSGAFEFAARFPGQVFDSETAQHYNYFRDYDPTIGRYVQSDPIGLNGGVNSFSYSDQRPTIAMDRYGLVARGNHKLDQAQLDAINEQLKDPTLDTKTKNELKQKLKRHEKATDTRGHRGDSKRKPKKKKKKKNKSSKAKSRFLQRCVAAIAPGLAEMLFPSPMRSCQLLNDQAEYCPGYQPNNFSEQH